jgi:hypothetical protein
MYKFEKTVIFDKNEYKNVISISPSPTDPLKKITKRYSNNKVLSKFTSNHKGCLELLLDPTDMFEFLDICNIEYLIDYFDKNNIIINYELTKIMLKSNSNLLFYVQ